MIRSPRKTNAPKKFSPSQPNLYSQENYLLRFDDNDELLIVKRSSIRSIIEDKANVGKGQNSRCATIEAKGSYSQCNIMYEQLQLGQMNATDDDDDDQEEETDDVQGDDRNNDNNVQYKIPKQSLSTKKRKLSSCSSENNDENVDYPDVTTRKDLSISKKIRRSAVNLLTMQHTTMSNGNNKENESVEAQVVYQTIDDMHHTILQQLEKKFSSFSRKLNQMIPHAVHQNLDSYREKDEIFPKEVMYDNKNLLEIRARDIFDFGRKILKTLYTSEELGSSILPPARSHLARPSLDPVRFHLFHESIRVKYKISSLYYDNCYAKLVRPKMCDFLVDERKRQGKALKRQSMDNEERNLCND
ncbi:hypothetical protein I4U23_029734 [Adineta vaga]|nr:hypothetical protein I4U23_029734 [Adineta vaga]